MRGLKFLVVWHLSNQEVVAPFTGAWIEIACVCASLLRFSLSHPLRVRGLKSVNAARQSVQSRVAPFTGAWIEIQKFKGHI